MRNILFVGVVCLLASAAVVAAGKYQPLNVKTGTWLVTENLTSTGMPPRTITYKSCVTTEELNSNPFNDPEAKCRWTVLNSTGSDMEIRGNSCVMDSKLGAKADVHLKLHVVDSEHVKGSGDWTMNMNGQDLTGNATGSGKWISATCSRD